MVKISVITVTYNAIEHLEQTIQNVLSQSYLNIEYIIIDGGSADGSLDIIKKYQHKLSYWISEPDQGISDAFNKGVRAATGDYLYFLGVGDYFWNNNVIDKMFENVNPQKDMLVCGKINRIADDSVEKVLYTSKINFNKYFLLYKMGLPHQALFMSKSFFKKYGLFDISLKFSMDYELLLRAYKDFPCVIMKDIVVAAWRAGGIGKDKTLEVFKEYNIIKHKNKISSPLLLVIINVCIHINYYLKKVVNNEYS